MMYDWLINYLIVFLLSAFLTWTIIPRILLIAFRKRLFDIPDARKVHHGVVPRLGGIAFNPIMILSFLLLLGVNLWLGRTVLMEAVLPEALSLSFAASSLLVLYLVGAADDLIGVRYREKFIAQIFCGVFMVVGGFALSNLTGMFGLEELPLWFSAPLTVFAVLFILNAINLIDGLDGLASGISILALAVYAAAFLLSGANLWALFAFSGLGVLAPFYYYNVFGNVHRGRKIFMGDTGSLTVGMFLTMLSIKLLHFSLASGAPLGVNPFVLAFAPLLIPCMDVVRVYLHRVRMGQSPFLPDKNHIHHKLMLLGYGPHTSMVLIVSGSLLTTLANILASRILAPTWLLAIDAVAYTVLNLYITDRIAARGRHVKSKKLYKTRKKEQLQNEIA